MNLSQAFKLLAERATANRTGEELLQGLLAVEVIGGALGRPDGDCVQIQAQASKTVTAMMHADEMQLRWSALLEGKAE